MGISTASDIGAILTTAFGTDLYRLWNRRANFLANAVQLKEGEFKSVFWAASAPSATDSLVVAEGHQFVSSEYNLDTMVDLTLPRAIYTDVFSLSDTEIAVAARSPLSPTSLIDMVRERVFESLTRVTSKVNKDCYTGTGTDSISGQQSIVGLESALITSGNYASKSVTSIPSLQSNVSGSDGSPVALTTAQMQEMITAINIRSGEKPDMILCHPYVANALQALYETDRRIVNMDNALTRYSSGPSDAFDKLQGADSGMSFMGIPVLQDKDAYSFGVPGDGYGHMYFVKKQFLEMNVMPHRNPFDGSTWENTPFLSSNGQDDEYLGAPFINITSLARNGLAASFAVSLEAQLAVKRPMALGILKGIVI